MHPQGNQTGQSLDAATVVLRLFDQELDQAFIYSSWRNSAFYLSVPAIEESAADFFKNQNAKIKLILRHAQVRIGCLQDCPYVIVGYCVSTGRRLDWIYVKEDYRMRGIGSFLLPKGIETFPDPMTKIGEAILKKKKLKTQGETHGHQTEPAHPARPSTGS